MIYNLIRQIIIFISKVCNFVVIIVLSNFIVDYINSDKKNFVGVIILSIILYLSIENYVLIRKVEDE